MGGESINPYTEMEICTLYRDARKKSRQIEILCQLTCLPKVEITRILKKHGMLEEDKKKGKKHDQSGK